MTEGLLECVCATRTLVLRLFLGVGDDVNLNRWLLMVERGVASQIIHFHMESVLRFVI